MSPHFLEGFYLVIPIFQCFEFLWQLGHIQRHIQKVLHLLDFFIIPFSQIETLVKLELTKGWEVARGHEHPTTW